MDVRQEFASLSFLTWLSRKSFIVPVTLSLSPSVLGIGLPVGCQRPGFHGGKTGS